jgi:hypothetical protein
MKDLQALMISTKICVDTLNDTAIKTVIWLPLREVAAQFSQEEKIVVYITKMFSMYYMF